MCPFVAFVFKKEFMQTFSPSRSFALELDSRDDLDLLNLHEILTR